MKSILPKIAVFIVVALFMFVIAFHKYQLKRIRHAMQEHAQVVAGPMWDLNPKGVNEYLFALVRHYNYEHIEILSSDGTEFIEARHPGPSRLENRLIRLKLIPRRGFTSDIYYNKEFLGTINAQWLDRSIFVYAYASLVGLLLFAVVQLYNRILKAKLTLEDKVEARTRKLNEKTRELQKSEELYRSLVDNIGIGVALISPRMEVLALNQQMKRWFPKVDETQRPICYKSFKCPPQETICSYCPTHRTFIDGRTHEALTENQTPGGVRHFRVVSGPVRDESGKIISAIEMVEDRTQQVESEKDARELKTLLEHAQKMEAIGTLAGGIAHDFNNILGAIFGYTDLARCDIDDPQALSGHLDELYSGAERAGELVEQILTFSRKADHEKQALQISSIVREALKLLRSTIPATISIKEEILSEALVYADPTRIHQIVMNLCTNAYHAMIESGGTLSISLKEVEAPVGMILSDAVDMAEKYLQLEIRDTGTGMDKKTKAKIFDPYFTTKAVGEGTGLGLALVHGIVKDHDGSINVYSEPNLGTTFQVYLPISKAAKNTSIVKKEEEILRGGHETIMSVDDDVKLLEVVEKSLINQGYRVFSFDNGVQAYQEFKKHPDKYDLLLTDMTMPFITGAELAMKTLAIRPSLPIILFTGHSELINREKALKMGIREYSQKPIQMNKMLSMVRKVLDTSRVN